MISDVVVVEILDLDWCSAEGVEGEEVGGELVWRLENGLVRSSVFNDYCDVKFCVELWTMLFLLLFTGIRGGSKLSQSDSGTKRPSSRNLGVMRLSKPPSS